MIVSTIFVVGSLYGLVFFQDIALAQQPAPSYGLYFTLNGAVYLPGDTVLITDVGYYYAGTSLVCVTSNVNTQCCRNSDNPHGGSVGEWYFPDGSIVPRNRYTSFATADFTRTGFTHEVRLNRRNAITPIGLYECRVPAENNGLVYKSAMITIAHLLVTLDDDHEMRYLSVGSDLSCLAPQCCSNNPHSPDPDVDCHDVPSGIGSWIYPNGSYVCPTIAEDSYGINRRPGQVNLHRQGFHVSEGIWRCVVPGEGGANEIINIGIYSTGRGILVVTKDIYISRVLSLDPLVFVLACETTGGPSTRVRWRKNQYRYDIPTENGKKQQIIANYEDATYVNEIVISGQIIAGRYYFFSSNAATGYVSSSFDVSGVRLLHNGQTVSNNSIIGMDELPAGAVLLCSTDRSFNCCQSNGFWKSPSGTSNTDVFDITFSTSLLQVQRTDWLFQAHHNGMWHCQIPDDNNAIHHVYVGLYGQGQGAIAVSEEVEFSLISEDPPVFTLTCTTTGGPATTVEWTRNGVRLNDGGDDTMTRIIVDTQRSTYKNRLTVSGRQLGVYSVNVSNSRTPSPVLSQYTVTEASPPLHFTLALFSDDGVRVTWTPAPSADNTVVYIIYYNNGNVSGQVSVSTLALHHTLRGLVFGGTYSISMAARTDFESRIGPKIVLIGIPDTPESIRAVSRVTSIQLHWSPPSEYHGPITRYQVSYRCADSAATSVVSTGTTWTLTGLRPEISCTMRVRANTGAGAGDYSNTVTATTTPLPVVGGVLVEKVMDASSIRLAWEPVVLQDWQVDHYTIYYTAFSTSTSKTVHQQTVHTPSTKTSEVFYLTHLDPKFEHHFQVTVSIEVEGEEFESLKHTPLIFNFDVSHFQLHLSPVDNCASWEDSKASSLEHSIQLALTEAVSELCNCSFSAKFLRTGEFRCWNSPSEVTYRSTVVGMATYNSSQIVGYIESWVRSKTAVVRVGRISLQVLSGESCAVGVSSLSEGECGRTSTLSLVSQDPGTIKCVKSCLVQNGTSTCGN